MLSLDVVVVNVVVIVAVVTFVDVIVVVNRVEFRLENCT